MTTPAMVSAATASGTTAATTNPLAGFQNAPSNPNPVSARTAVPNAAQIALAQMSLQNEVNIIEYIRAADTLHAERMKTHLGAAVALDGYVTGVMPRRSNVPIEYARTSFKLPHSSVAPNAEIYQAAQEFVSDNAMKISQRDTTRRQIVYHVPPMTQAPCISVFACASYCSLFYEETTTGLAVNHTRFISAYATLLASIVKENLDVGMSRLVVGIDADLIPIRYTTEQEYMDGIAVDNPYVNAFWDILGKQGWRSREPVYCLTGVFMQTIGRNVAQVALDEWFKRRLTASCQSIGYTAPNQMLQYKPHGDTVRRANTAMSGQFKFRKFFFQAILGLSEIETMFGRVCAHVVNLLAFSEMSYVLTIQRYILDKCPEILNAKEMAGEEENILRMIIFVASHKKKAPYIKLLVPHEECQPLHRAALKKSIVVATMIAQRSEPSFANYYVDKNTAFYKTMDQVLMNYLAVRSDTAIIDMINDPQAGVGEMSKAAMLGRIQHMGAITGAITGMQSGSGIL